MSRITIRQYLTDGPTFVRAEIVWNPDDPSVESVLVKKELPTGELASLQIIPSASVDGFITARIYPNDVPETDVFSLPINLSGPLPAPLVGAELPSLYYTTSYRIEALSDTPLGFRVTAGNAPEALA